MQSKDGLATMPDDMDMLRTMIVRVDPHLQTINV